MKVSYGTVDANYIDEVHVGPKNLHQWKGGVADPIFKFPSVTLPGLAPTPGRIVSSRIQTTRSDVSHAGANPDFAMASKNSA
eukprot:8105066-Pyramimonas_sp.AAC.1